MARRKFRRVYLICEGNKIFGDLNYQMVNMYRERRYAESVCKRQIEIEKGELNKMYNKDLKPSTRSVHAFYLVHESYFDENKEP